MEPVVTNNSNTENSLNTEKKETVSNPFFTFMEAGSLLYAFLFTFFLYKNNSGITYPFFVGGTCCFFFLYLRKSGITAKKTALFPFISMILLGISTCMTDSWILIFFNKLGIFFLFFYLVLHSMYEDKHWDFSKYLSSIINIICTSLVFILRPFTDFFVFLKNEKEKKDKPEGNGKYIFFGILIAIPLLFVILLLLGGADAVFSSILDKLFSWDFNFKFNHIFEICSLFLFAFIASYSMMCRLSLHNIKEEYTDKRKLEPVIGITFTSLISLVYLIFCYIQIFYLFGGLGTLPDNYTYASYAREGFFQLVFVCLINLILVLVCMKYFRENKVLKGILTFISLCTYIMIASSVYRMVLYIKAYDLTFLRVFVLWSLLIIFLLVSGALIMIYRKDFPYTGFCLVTVTILYLVFSFSHPDYWIARYNLSSKAETDYYYLKRLSLDSAPAIFNYKANSKFNINSDTWFEEYASRMVRKSYDFKVDELDEIWKEEGNCLPKNLSLRKWNLSRWTAYKDYEKYYESNPDFSKEIEYNIMCYVNDYYGWP